MKKIILLILITQLFTNCSSKKINSKFEKITFHTSKCFGTCPEYHLELKQNRKIKLYIEKAYKDHKLDTEKIGFYRGKLNKETYNEFLSILKKIDLEKSGIESPPIEANTIILREGSQLTLILYFDNERKPIKYIYPAGLWQELMSFLYKIADDKNLLKVNEEIEIESFN
jgi:hypothetical protein